MNNKTLLLLTAAAFLSTSGFAQDASIFKIKNRSKFSGTQIARDPFWPIGWKKESRGDSTVVEADFSADDFVVTSILLSPPALAVINGKEYGEGQFIPLPGGVKAQVAAIQDGSVVILYHGKTVTTSLRRNEHLSTPKPYDPADASSVQAAVSPR